MLIKPIKQIRENITLPGDKSISHRAIMLSSLACGKSHIYNFLMGDDCRCTIDCFRQMGVPIKVTDKKIRVTGQGLKGLKKPPNILNAGNSGTTMRLICGILAGQNFECQITGDASLQGRPMERIINPLTEMGGVISGLRRENYPPLAIQGRKLKAIDYLMPVASAQVKSAVLLAGLYGAGVTRITEIQKSRDHTERMLKFMGGNIEQKGLTISLGPTDELQAQEIHVPGDISSAAFFLVLGAIVKDGEIILKDVGLNPTRTGVIDVLKEMGARLKVFNEKLISGEPVGDLAVSTSPLRGVEIGGEIIPRLIDEIPVIAVAAAFAQGTTIIKDAAELKVKETNRILAVVNELRKMGAQIEETADGMIIQGIGKLSGGQVKTYGDHRMAMALTIAGLASIDGVSIDDPSCVDISFPGFFEMVNKIEQTKN